MATACYNLNFLQFHTVNINPCSMVVGPNFLMGLMPQKGTVGAVSQFANPRSSKPRNCLDLGGI